MKNSKKKSKSSNVNLQLNSDNSNEIDEIFSAAKNKKASSRSSPVREAKSQTTNSKDTAPESPSAISTNERIDDDEKEKLKSSKAKEFVFKVPAIPDRSKSNKRKLIQNDDDGFSDSRGTKIRKSTEDGFAIYNANELNIGNGGDTPLCPFDCDCCKHLPELQSC
ncbi:12512_t:CDS:2 [Acaulospora morrowiae]|uniref:12512_t:CDS:1 n=1 Tax=Acaulospora morrowiae TaxID=94023 RepID=A0A9N9FGW2_9GLOM|nr:12512_t:CDS:2 [Acaulospora morrowiae]